MQKGFSSLQIIAVIIIVALLVAGAYFLGKNTSSAPIVSTNSVTKPESTEPAQIVSKNDEKPIATEVKKFTYIKDGDIYVYDLENKTNQKLTNYGYNTAPILSPDNSKVAYLSIPEEVVKSGKAQKFPGSGLFSHPISHDRQYNVWIINTDGTSPIKVTSSLKQRSELSWYNGPLNSNLLLFKENDKWVRYNLNSNTQTASSLSVEDLPTYAHNSGTYAYLTNNGKTLNIQPNDGFLKSVDHNYKIITLNWSWDNKYILLTTVEELKQEGAPRPEFRYAIWYYSEDTKKIEAITSYKERRHSPTISPGNNYIATLQGTGYADAGNIDLGLAIIKVNNFAIEKSILLSDFKGSNFFEKEKQFMFPVGNIIWLDDKELVVQLDALVDPQPNPRGIYKLNLKDLSAERLVELN